MTSELAVPPSNADRIAAAAEAMRTFCEETLPRLVVAERTQAGLRTWWADYKRRQP